MADKTLQQQVEERQADQQFREDHREMVAAHQEEERREAAHRRWAEQRRLDALRDEERRHEDEHQKWMKGHLLDPDAARAARRLEERVEADERRVEALRSHPDPVVRAAGEKIWAAREAQAAAEEQWETSGDGEEEAEREAAAEAARAERLARDPEPDPGWLARWEREGTLSPLTPAEREKLRALDREDPFGREQRAMFLPREVLAIRAHSDRMVEAREQEHHHQQQHEAEAGEHKQEPGHKHQAPELEQDQDDELEL